MSDSLGNLIFYSNGCKIINRKHELMDNGDTINAGPLHTLYCIDWNGGYDDMQGQLTIPRPGHPDEYLLFHLARQYAPAYPYLEMILYYSRIDMRANGGLGRVVEKNQYVFGPDTVQLSITANRHANGRDWWIMLGRPSTNIFYTFLATPDGISAPIVQDWRHTWQAGESIARVAAFSPDGSYFVRNVNGTPAAFTLFRFDRCSGLLSDPRHLTLPDSSMVVSWVAFSPNSRFLYVTNKTLYLYQFDLLADDVDNSKQLIGTWDGFIDTTLNVFPTTFHTMTNGPDGKIYISTQTATRFLHTIHKPNEKGLACDFRQHDILTPSYIAFFLPNFPHYRLYDLPDSPCDTLGIEPTPRPPGQPNRFLLTPNPTAGDAELRFAWPAEEGHRLRVYNMLGQLLYETTPPPGTQILILPSSNWPAGSYAVVLEQAGQTVYSRLLGKVGK